MEHFVLQVIVPDIIFSGKKTNADVKFEVFRLRKILGSQFLRCDAFSFSLVWRVVDSGRVLGAGSNMGCYLEDYRARVCTWAAKTVWRLQGRNINGQMRSDLANMCLFAVVLALILITDGVEQNPGPGAGGESFIQVNCSACERILKWRTQCDTCGRWFHNSCRNVKAQFTDSGKWSCERCKLERLTC